MASHGKDKINHKGVDKGATPTILTIGSWTIIKKRLGISCCCTHTSQSSLWLLQRREELGTHIHTPPSPVNELLQGWEGLANHNKD